MRATNLGTLRAKLEADTKGWHGGLSGGKSALSGFGSAVPGLLKPVGIAIAGVGAAIVGMSTIIALETKKALETYAGLEQEMAQVSTLIVEDTEKWTNQLTTGVQDIMTVIPDSMGNLTSALYDLLSASIPVNESLQALELSGKAAIAGATDVMVAGDTLTSIMNALGISGDQMGTIYDQIFEAIRVGKFRFADLGQYIGMMLGPAQTLNVELPELLGAFADITAKGHPAARAATSLGAALDGLIKNKDQLEKFGIKVFGEEGEFRGILEVMEDMAGVLTGMTQEERADIIKEMGFTKRGERAIVAMIENVDSLGSRIGDVEAAAGTMEEAYDKMKDTLQNQWTLLGNAVEVLKQKIGSEFGDAASGALGSMTRFATNIGKLLTEEEGLPGLWKKHGDMIMGVFSAISTGVLEMVVELLVASTKLMAEGGRRLVEKIGWSVADAFEFVVKGTASEIKEYWGQSSKETFAEFKKINEGIEAKGEERGKRQRARTAAMMTDIGLSAATAMKASLDTMAQTESSFNEYVESIIGSSKEVTTTTTTEEKKKTKVVEDEAEVRLQATQRLHGMEIASALEVTTTTTRAAKTITQTQKDELGKREVLVLDAHSKDVRALWDANLEKHEMNKQYFDGLAVLTAEQRARDLAWAEYQSEKELEIRERLAESIEHIEEQAFVRALAEDERILEMQNRSYQIKAERAREDAKVRTDTEDMFLKSARDMYERDFDIRRDFEYENDEERAAFYESGLAKIQELYDYFLPFYEQHNLSLIEIDKWRYESMLTLEKKLAGEKVGIITAVTDTYAEYAAATARFWGTDVGFTAPLSEGIYGGMGEGYKEMMQGRSPGMRAFEPTEGRGQYDYTVKAGGPGEAIVINIETMYGGDEAALNDFAEDIARRIQGQNIQI